MSLVSVIVPLRNAEAAVDALLDALDAQDLSADRREVVIIDDASTDGTAAAAAARGARVERLRSWSGAYAARNLGIRVARGNVLAFTDGDCRPRPDWLRHALEDLDRFEADVLVGHVEVTVSARPGPVELVDFARYLDQERALREGGFGATANLVVRRPVVDRIGSFNARVISDGDREFCHRAAAGGFQLAYSPRAVVVHGARRGIFDVMRRGFRDGIGRAQIRRHGRGIAAPLPAVWRRPGAWIPSALIGRSEVYGIERLSASGRPPSPSLRRRMALAEWACVQLPYVAGNLVGEAREVVRR